MVRANRVADRHGTGSVLELSKHWPLRAAVLLPSTPMPWRVRKILDPTRLTRARLAQDVMEVADEAGLAAYDLAGYSLGGFISVIVAVKDRRVRRLAICGSGDQLFMDQLADPDHGDVPAALRSDDPVGDSSISVTAQGFRQFADFLGSDRMALAACF